jgi:predicted DNA-binding transcriptional regulator AlpA
MPSKTDLPPVPAALVEVALIGGPTSAAIGEVSLSQWHDLVRAGDAPQPVIREPRFTRWKLADVRAYWAERAARGSDPKIVAQVTAHAAKASRKAAELRAAAQIFAQDATQAKRARRKAPNGHSTDVDLEPAAQPAQVQE